METDKYLAVLGVVAATLLALPTPIRAEEEPENEPRWSNTAELSILATGGNSEAESLAIRNTLTRKWDEAAFELALGAFRTETTTQSRFAVGTPNDFDVQDVSETNLTAENYFLRGRYDRDLSEKLFWFAGGGWERNEFAGIENRYVAAAGLGNLWFETDRARFRTDYGITFTDQEDIVGGDDSFAGLRLSWDYWRQLSKTAGFDSVLLLDENLDDTSDLRVDFTNSVSASLSQLLSLKVSLQLLFDNQPALAAVPLFDLEGQPTDASVLVELEDLDSILTVSLVMGF